MHKICNTIPECSCFLSPLVDVANFFQGGSISESSFVSIRVVDLDAHSDSLELSRF